MVYTRMQYTGFSKVFFFQNAKWFRHTCAFPMPIFVKYTSAKQHYVQICDTKLHLNGAINMKREDRNLLIPLCTEPIFTKVVNAE